jgi:hypothetical protein
MPRASRSLLDSVVQSTRLPHFDLDGDTRRQSIWHYTISSI